MKERKINKYRCVGRSELFSALASRSTVFVDEASSVHISVFCWTDGQGADNRQASRAPRQAGNKQQGKQRGRQASSRTDSKQTGRTSR